MGEIRDSIVIIGAWGCRNIEKASIKKLSENLCVVSSFLIDVISLFRQPYIDSKNLSLFSR